MLVIASPGQGAQKSGFLSSWLDIPEFADALSQMADAVGLDLIAHGTTSDDETIKDTAIAQPLLVASAIATAGILLGDTRPSLVAGHSVGEIAAAQIAGILSPADAMTFVSVRAQGMAAASALEPTGMAAVVGGVSDDVLAAIAAAGLTPANVNGGGQTVAAGSLSGIEQLVANPPERARVIPLKVAGAFHTEYMSPAQPELATTAQSITAQDPTTSILTNADGTVVTDGRAYVDLLVGQVTHPVRWDLCQATMLDAGVTGFLELVPGGTLTGLAKRAMKGVETFAVKSADDVDGARAFIAAHS